MDRGASCTTRVVPFDYRCTGPSCGGAGHYGKPALWLVPGLFGRCERCSSPSIYPGFRRIGPVLFRSPT